MLVEAMALKRGSAKSVTIADVARAAGVAPMTVSRAINEHSSVRPGTLLKVREAIDRLGYTPNHAARMLMGIRSNSIALVIPELTNPFFSIVANGVQAAARARGALVWMVASNNDVEIEHKEIERLLSYRVDGILLISSSPGHRYLKDIVARGTPLVAVDLPIENAATDAVLVENRQGSQEAVEHLIGHGYRSILCLGAWPKLFTMRERIAGYEASMQAAGLVPNVQTDAGDVASTRRAIEMLVSRKRSRAAIFSLNQLTTEIVLNLLGELGVSVPDQIGLIGFDDFPFASLLKPKLTVVRQPAGELGRCAANILFEKLDSKESIVPRRTMLATELVIRESCGCKESVTPRE